MRLRHVSLLIIALVLAVSMFSVLVKSNGYQPPTSSFTYSPQYPAPEDTITFDGSSSHDPDGWIVQYRWNFGDGTVITATNPITAYCYHVDGTYTVELTVTDNNGLTGTSSAVIQVSTITFFRVCILGTLIPMSNVKVTAYYKSGTNWVPAPVGPGGFEVKYDNMTQPDLANTDAERYRNPGYTASILRQGASNIGFDIHPEWWIVYFKFEWGPFVAYWPNETTRVYSYKDGAVETRDYLPGHSAYWDASASTYVIKAKHIPGQCVSPTESHPIIVGISCPPSPNYYLTVKTNPAGLTTIPGEGWYTKNTNITLTAPLYINISTTTRYRFNYWDVDGTSRGAGVNPITVFMDANHTATAHYILQYAVIFNQTGLSADATGTVATVNGSTKTYSDLPYYLWVDNGGSVTYSYSVTVSSSITGKRFGRVSISGPGTPIMVTGPTTVTGNYATQYMVTFAQTGLDSTAIGTVVTVNGSTKAYGDLPLSWWVDSGSTVTYSYSSTVASSVTDKQFRLTGVYCPPSPFVVTGSITITGSYCIQYKVKFTHAGLDSTATGTVVTVNGSAKTYSQLPYSLWTDAGNSLTYSYSSTMATSYPDKQFRLNSVTGPSSPITLTGPTTVTGNYVCQYRVTFTQTGLDSTATGTVVTVNGSAKTYSQLPYSLWTDSGSTVIYSYTSPVTSSTSGKQFRLDTVIGPTSPITVSGATTVTGNYVVQYYLTVTSPYGVTGGQGWYDSGSTAYATLSTGAIDHGNGTCHVFTNWNGDASGTNYAQSNAIGMNGAKNAIAQWKTQYFATFAQSGLDATATGTVVTVNGSGKTYSQLPYVLWVDSGSSITYSYGNVSSSTTGKRFILTSVSGPSSPITVTTPITVTGNYKTQYKVSFDQSGVGLDFTGTIVTVDSVNYNGAGLPVDLWWDQGTNHNFTFISPLTVNVSKQYVWSSTSGLSTLQSGTLTISVSGSVTGNYVIQNCVTFDQTGASSDFTGTVVTIDGTPYGVSSLPAYFYWQLGTIHSFAFQSPLVVTPSSKQYVWTSTTGLSTIQNGSITVTTFGSIIGHYKTQYYLNVTTSPTGLNNPTGSGWYDDGTYASISTEQYVPGGSRWRFAGWTTGDMSEIANPSSPSTTVFVDMAKTVTANYVHQYLITFTHTGLASDASGTVVIVNGTATPYASLPYSIWVDIGGIVNYSYETTVSSTITGKHFSLTSVTGPSSPMTVSADTNVTGNYGTQYYLTVTSPYATTGGQGWYDSGSTAYATLNTGTVDHGNGTSHVFTNWNGDASGTNYVTSNPITMNAAKTAVAQWKTQHYITFIHSGLDSSASSTVVTVNSAAKAYGDLPYALWADAGGSVTYSYSNVSSSTAGKRFILTGVSDPSSPITIAGPTTVTGNYKIQYQITFNQTGAGSDFVGTIVTIDGADYSYGSLPVSFWWDSGSSHSFAFTSPLVVNISRQYAWYSTTGLSSLQSETLTITNSGNVTGNYTVETKYQVTFDKTGVDLTFTGTIVIIDGTNYGVPQLPVSFWWASGSTHTFAYLSPLEVGPNTVRYVWFSTSGPWPVQNGTITVSTSGNVVGNYKTQYYLTLTTSPPDVTSPSGEGWYDAGTNATISTAAFVDIVPGVSRYRFNGWTTTNMTEIADPARSPTTVVMDEAKTVTANYVIQYQVTFNQTGVGPDFSDNILTVDYSNYNSTNLPILFWWDSGSTHTFAFQSPLIVTPNVKQYAWVSTSGSWPVQNGTITVSTSGNVIGNYKTQYYLEVHSLYDSPTPSSGWIDAGTSITASITTLVTGPSGTRYVCTGWTGTGSVPSSGTGSSVTFTMDQPSTITWNWKTQYYLTVKTYPLGIAAIPGEGWYDDFSSVVLTAPSVANYSFSYWDVDTNPRGTGVNPITVAMNGPHTATAHYGYVAPTLTVAITPLTAAIPIGDSIYFTSAVNGGTSPYTYQWYLGGNPVTGATSPTWLFMPTAPGTFYVYLRVTDANNNTALSETARVIVFYSPVGGYAVPLDTQPPTTQVAAYLAIVTLFGAILGLKKRKRK